MRNEIGNIDYLLMDETGQLTTGQVAGALSGVAQRSTSPGVTVVFAGDVKQLGPVVKASDVGGFKDFNLRK